MILVNVSSEVVAILKKEHGAGFGFSLCSQLWIILPSRGKFFVDGVSLVIDRDITATGQVLQDPADHLA